MADPVVPGGASSSAPRSPLREPQRLDDLFLYRLAQLQNLARQPVVRLCEREAGITRREWRLLALLAEHPGIAPSALAERAGLDRARTSRALGRLAAKGLLLRAAAPADRREARLSLTPAGEAAYQRLLPRIAAINQSLLAELNEAELAQLDALLHRLRGRAAALQDMGAPPAR